MNPFEYGKSLIGKSFPKRFGTLTPPNPKLFCGGHNAPPLVFRYAQIGWSNGINSSVRISIDIDSCAKDKSLVLLLYNTITFSFTIIITITFILGKPEVSIKRA